MSLQDQIRIYKRQAEWTSPMRRELYRRVRLASRKSVLDVGCGEGTITREMAGICKGEVQGVDLDPQMIASARDQPGTASFSIGDAHALDFRKSAFDLVACHWLLLWLKKPEAALQEFRRVLKPDGTLLVACEPDFKGRMVFPESAALYQEIISALKSRGADPLMGRKIPGLLNDAGFKATSGLYPGLWDSGVNRDFLETEIDWLETLLSGRMEKSELDQALLMIRQAHSNKKLLIHTPIFWAIAQPS